MFPRISRGEAGKALEDMAAAICNHAAAVRAILDEVAVAEDEAECQRAKDVTMKWSIRCKDAIKK